MSQPTTDAINTALLAKAATQAEEDVTKMIYDIFAAVSIPTRDDLKQPSNFKGIYMGIDAEAYEHCYRKGEDSMRRFKAFCGAVSSLRYAMLQERTAFLHARMVKDLLEKVSLLG